MKILIITGSTYDPASRFRLIQFIPHFERIGIQADLFVPKPDRFFRSPIKRPHSLFWLITLLGRKLTQKSIRRVIAASSQYDLVIVNRDLIPWEKSAKYEEMLAQRAHRFIFDFDDAIFLNSPVRKIARICQIADVVLSGNEYLASFAAEYTRDIRIFPTVIDTETYRPRENRDEGPVKVVWSGSDMSYPYVMIQHVKQALYQCSQEHPFQLVIIKNTPFEPSDWSGMDVVFHPWTQQSEVATLAMMDVGIMPLEDDPFQRGKCGLKILQYLALAIPAIASPVGVNKKILGNTNAGFLAATRQDWVEALRRLIRDSSLRVEMGRRGRALVERDYSVQTLLKEYKKLLFS